MAGWPSLGAHGWWHLGPRSLSPINIIYGGVSPLTMILSTPKTTYLERKLTLVLLDQCPCPLAPWSTPARSVGTKLEWRSSEVLAPSQVRTGGRVGVYSLQGGRKAWWARMLDSTWYVCCGDWAAPGKIPAEGRGCQQDLERGAGILFCELSSTSCLKATVYWGPAGEIWELRKKNSTFWYFGKCSCSKSHFSFLVESALLFMWMLICDWGHSLMWSSCWARPGKCQLEHLSGMGVSSCDKWAGLSWSQGLSLTHWPFCLRQAGKPVPFPGGCLWCWCAQRLSMGQSGLSQAGQASSHGSHPGAASFSGKTVRPAPALVPGGTFASILSILFYFLSFLFLPPPPFFEPVDTSPL